MTSKPESAAVESGSDKEKTEEHAQLRVITTLAPELAKHYDHYQVEGVGAFVSRSGHCDRGSRFIRLNPRFDRAETLALLKAELPPHSPPPTPISWLHPRLGFFAIPGDFRLAMSQSFKSGRIYGMDVSSGAAVAALLFDEYDAVSLDGRDYTKTTPLQSGALGGELRPVSKSTSSTDDKGNSHSCAKHEASNGVNMFRVLDLCCAPGLKLCAMADLMPESSPSVVIGVDVSENRISLCKGIVKKYFINSESSGLTPTRKGTEMVSADSERLSPPGVSIHLYCADGTTFGTEDLYGLVFDSAVTAEESRFSGNESA